METFACTTTTRDEAGNVVDFHASYVMARSEVGFRFAAGETSVVLPASGWPTGYATEYAR